MVLFVYINKDDLRAIELSKMMSNKGYYVTSDLKDIEYADIVYLGVKGPDRKNRINCFDETFILDHVMFSKLKENCLVLTIACNNYLLEMSNEYHFRYCCLNDNSYFIDENSMLCAEGIIAYIIKKRPYSLLKSKIAVFGSGHIASALINVLLNMNIDSDLCSRKKVTVHHKSSLNIKDMKNLKDYDVIVNTVPALVIDHEMIDTIKDDALIIDVASFPYGLDHHYAINAKKNCYVLSSIPSRYAYKYAADVMMHVIEDEYNDM